jgi:alkylhydroperoxidase family enzyme
MARIDPKQPPYSNRTLEDFAKLMPPGMEPLALFRTLAHNERVLGRIRRGGLLDAGSISLRQREIVILRTTALAGAEYEWGVHVAFFAAAAKLDADAQYATVWLDARWPGWAAGEAALVRLCDELHATARLSDEAWRDLRASFDDAQLIEAIVLAGFYRSIANVVNATGVELEPTATRFPAKRAAASDATHTGSCLCGSVRYTIRGEPGPFGYCHCTSCRKASGSAHAANAPVERAQFELVSGHDTLREYESTPGKLRAFCSRCGSPIYAYLRATPELLRIRLGSLDTPLAGEPRAHTWVSDKASWEPIDDAVPQFPEWADKSVLDQRGTRQK